MPDSPNKPWVDAMAAINKIRLAAWKGNIAGVAKAVETLDSDMTQLFDAWTELAAAANLYEDDKSAETRESLTSEIDAFDEALRMILGPHKWEIEAEAAGTLET